MYITINNIIGEKRIDLPFPIHNRDGFKTIAIVNVFIFQQQKPKPETKAIQIYTGGHPIVVSSDDENEMIDIVVNELDGTDNIVDGRLSNRLLSLIVSDQESRFEPQYKKLRSDTLTALTVKISDQATSSFNVTLHIKP
ncbi:MAG: hypothetical protein ACKVQA_26550 [Burkholderiales bacterium]